MVDFVLTQSGAALLTADRTGMLLQLSPGVETLIGHKPDSLLHPATPAAVAASEQFRAVLRDGVGERWSGPITCADGVDRQFDVILSDFAETQAGQTRRMALIRGADSSQPFVANDIDELTGLPGQTIFRDRAIQTILQARRSGGSVALVLVGLDRVGLVSDALGVAAGDQLLAEIARRLQKCVRVVDSVVRLDGERFAVVMALTAERDAVVVAEKVMAAIKMPFTVAGHEIAVTASLGIGIAPHDANDIDTLMKHAQTALDHAKNSESGQYRFFSTDLNSKAKARLDIEARMRRALAQEEFLVYFQPKVRSGDGLIVGAEALVRWRDPVHGMISPANFIPVAEETGMIEALGTWVLRQSCLQNKAWQDMGLPKICMSVNVSGRQFRNAALVDTVRSILDESGLEAEWLELEITESMLMNDVEQMVQRMSGLRDLGVGLSIDDFGTGYSSLSYLGRFPITTLKIDRAFIVDVESNPRTAEIARAIIGLSKGLNLDVVAEGCEVEEHVRFLSHNGCSTIQGYYYSRPLPAADFEALLHRGSIIAPK